LVVSKLNGFSTGIIKFPVEFVSMTTTHDKLLKFIFSGQTLKYLY